MWYYVIGINDIMCDDITCEDLHLASVAGLDDITCDDLNPESVRLWYWNWWYTMWRSTSCERGWDVWYSMWRSNIWRYKSRVCDIVLSGLMI